MREPPAWADLPAKNVSLSFNPTRKTGANACALRVKALQPGWPAGRSGSALGVFFLCVGLDFDCMFCLQKKCQFDYGSDAEEMKEGLDPVGGEESLGDSSLTVYREEEPTE